MAALRPEHMLPLAHRCSRWEEASMVSLHILPSPQRRDSQSGIPSLVWGAGEYLDTASGKDWSPQGRGPCCSLSAAVTGASP